MGWFAAREHIRRDALTDGSGVDFRMTAEISEPAPPRRNINSIFPVGIIFNKDPERNLEKIKRTITSAIVFKMFGLLE